MMKIWIIIINFNKNNFKINNNNNSHWIIYLMEKKLYQLNNKANMYK